MPLAEAAAAHGPQCRPCWSPAGPVLYVAPKNGQHKIAVKYPLLPIGFAIHGLA